jgi:hypothetical protein
MKHMRKYWDSMKGICYTYSTVWNTIEIEYELVKIDRR